MGIKQYDNYSWSRRVDLAYTAALHGNNDVSNKLANSIESVIENTRFMEAALGRGSEKTRAKEAWNIQKIGVFAAQGDIKRAEKLVNSFSGSQQILAQLELDLALARLSKSQPEKANYLEKSENKVFGYIKNFIKSAIKKEQAGDNFSWQGYMEVLSFSSAATNRIYGYYNKQGDTESKMAFLNRYVGIKRHAHDLDFLISAFTELADELTSKGEMKQASVLLETVSEIVSIRSTQFERDHIYQVYEAFHELGLGHKVVNEIDKDHQRHEHPKSLYIQEMMRATSRLLDEKPHTVPLKYIDHLSESVTKSLATEHQHRYRFFRYMELGQIYAKVGAKKKAQESLDLAHQAWMKGEKLPYNDSQSFDYGAPEDLLAYLDLLLRMATLGDEQISRAHFTDLMNHEELVEFIEEDYIEFLEPGLPIEDYMISGIYGLLDTLFNDTEKFEQLLPQLSGRAQFTLLKKYAKLYRERGNIEQSRKIYKRVFNIPSASIEANGFFAQYLHEDPEAAWQLTLNESNKQKLLSRLLYNWHKNIHLVNPTMLNSLEAKLN